MSKREGNLESETCQEIAAWLRAQKWLVRVASYHRPMPTGLRGIGDILAWKGDYHLIVEVKTPEGDRRDSQIDFWLELREKCPDALHVIYILATGLWAVQDELRHGGLIAPKARQCESTD
jgi:hypothetical protein